MAAFASRCRPPHPCDCLCLTALALIYRLFSHPRLSPSVIPNEVLLRPRLCPIVPICRPWWIAPTVIALPWLPRWRHKQGQVHGGREGNTRAITTMDAIGRDPQGVDNSRWWDHLGRQQRKGGSGSYEEIDSVHADEVALTDHHPLSLRGLDHGRRWHDDNPRQEVETAGWQDGCKSNLVLCK